jgi:hypothetical protein
MSYGDAMHCGEGGGDVLGNYYQEIRIGDYANAHLGDNNYFGEFRYEGRSGNGMLSRCLGPDNPVSRLPYATDAPFNAYTKQHDPSCLANTRIDLLDEIHS